MNHTIKTKKKAQLLFKASLVINLFKDLVNYFRSMILKCANVRIRQATLGTKFHLWRKTGLSASIFAKGVQGL